MAHTNEEYHEQPDALTVPQGPAGAEDLLDDVLTLKQAARLLQMLPNSLSSGISEGRLDIPHYRLTGRITRFRRSELLAWFKRRRRVRK